TCWARRIAKPRRARRRWRASRTVRPAAEWPPNAWHGFPRASCGTADRPPPSAPCLACWTARNPIRRWHVHPGARGDAPFVDVIIRRAISPGVARVDFDFVQELDLVRRLAVAALVGLLVGIE